MDLRRDISRINADGIARRETTLEEARALRVDGARYSPPSHRPVGGRDGGLDYPVHAGADNAGAVAELAPCIAPGTVLTDVGSTKRMVMNAAQTVLPAGVHSSAGTRWPARSGKDWRTRVTTCMPMPPGRCAYRPAARKRRERLTTLITALGARPLLIDADTHDSLVALTSHLPHVVAPHWPGRCWAAPRVTPCCRSSPAVSATPPASPLPTPPCGAISSSPTATKLVPVLNAFLAEIEQWRDAIRAGDEPHVEALLTVAGERRKRLG